ncbi:PIG-L deacetylase family protein [Geodermatophilus sp. SYSU D00742]
MLPLVPRAPSRQLRVLAVGAHPDDVEIGAGGALLELVRSVPDLCVDVVVLTGTPTRADEAQASADGFLSGAEHTVSVHGLPDGRLPAAWAEVKELLESRARTSPVPDLLIGPSRDESHQDHRVVAQILPTVFRDVLTLCYEVPKWDGDLIRRTLYVPMSDEVADRKVELLMRHFPSQRGRHWFDREVFLGLARLRGAECGARYAEAFTCSKSVMTFTAGGST